MGFRHYRVEAAWDRRFLAYIDADPANPEEVLRTLHDRKLLPPGFTPKDLAMVFEDDQKGWVQSISCGAGVCLYLSYSSLGSEQIADEEPETTMPSDHEQANDHLRYLLNELKAIEQKDNVRDRRVIIGRLDWLREYIDRPASIAPSAVAIIAEAHKLPVQI